jgi:AraC-like DNA-binding protein
MHQEMTLAEYCEDSILDIPNALFAMRDVTPMLFSNESAIFYKDLARELVNVEFYTSVPCIVYIESGREVITTCNDDFYEVGPGEAILLPKGLNLYSDYVKKDKNLNAYLLFYGADVLNRFISTSPTELMPITNEQGILKMEVESIVREYFVSLQSCYNALKNSQDLLNLKLLELLFLLELNDDGSLRKSLTAIQKGRAKRNIKRLVEQFAISELTAKELAELSGRSLSTFNREFKSIYNATPKQWLIDRRLAYSYMLLSEKQWSVTDAAIEAGYNNISHFIAAFKQKYGKTPHQAKFEL